MILVDTSVWVDYLRIGDETLAQMLIRGQVCIHPMVIGELACGHLQNRNRLINLWQNLPMLTPVSHQEAMFLLESRKLMGRGIGYVDLNLLAASLLSVNSALWTRDKQLARTAEYLGIAFSSHQY